MIDELEVAIDCFVAYYEATLSKATLTPTLHMLEDHMIPWIKLWNTGCALMGEQGAESLHAKFNSTKRAYNNMRHRVEGMKVLQNHFRLSHQANLLCQHLDKKERSRHHPVDR
uniref:Uncharacterized protein n=1 Tax=Amphimedon queenslandica TaxID=400682 RepID=A0A1X7VXA2_AMPQE